MLELITAITIALNPWAEPVITPIEPPPSLNTVYQHEPTAQDTPFCSMMGLSAANTMIMRQFGATLSVAKSPFDAMRDDSMLKNLNLAMVEDAYRSRRFSDTHFANEAIQDFGNKHRRECLDHIYWSQLK